MNYWVFQYTTTIYKEVITDFSEEKLEKWQVIKHIKKIKKGDKAIIYIGGKNAKAVYGVVKLESEVYFDENKERHYVDIKIVENWSLNPLKYAFLRRNIPSLSIGISGTNFKANETEYKKLLELKRSAI